MREDYYAGLEDRYFLTFEQAKEQKLVIDFEAVPPAPAPNKLGVTVIDSVSLEDVVPYIDWVRQTSNIIISVISHRTKSSCHRNFFFFSNSTESIFPNLGTQRPLSQPWISQDLQ